MSTMKLARAKVKDLKKINKKESHNRNLVKQGFPGGNSSFCGILPVKSLMYSGRTRSDQGRFWN